MSPGVLHIVRVTPPDPALVRAADLVVYTDPSKATDHDAPGYYIEGERGERRGLDSRALCELVFAYQRVVVW